MIKSTHEKPPLVHPLPPPPSGKQLLESGDFILLE
jgi:hypothetical protein